MLGPIGNGAARTLLAGVAVLTFGGCGGAPTPDSGPAPGEAVTFTRHIAPILYDHCIVCHRPDESAPFGLVEFRDVKKHDRQIAEVTQSGFMPPWLPAPGHGDFADARGLTDDQIELIRRWYEGGSAEGDPADLPPMPEFTAGWQLGEPDLIVEAPETYMLPADGVDVFRNLVIPIPLERRRYVRTIDVQPGNPKAVHHAVMRVDRSRSSRILAEEDDEAGYGGMRWAEAQPPEGHFLGWTPGRVPYAGSEEFAWTLEPGSDLVLQLHMVPLGKPEPIRPKVGFYFSDTPPTRLLDTIVLAVSEIEIPPGKKDYVREDMYEIPVDLELLSVYPHAHYLGKVLEGYAVLPDGTKQWLIKIPDWDFNWQDQYRFAEPLFLPAGTKIHMHFVYDNSAENPRNPNIPPRLVTWGLRSSDEMGSLSLEVSPRSAGDLARLKESIYRQDLLKDPEYWPTHGLLGSHLLSRGDARGAIPHLRRAIELNPGYALAYNNLGGALALVGRNEQAIPFFRKALEISPLYPDAHYNLGLQLAGLGRLDEAIVHYRKALEVRPHDAETHNNLAVALSMQNRLEEAIPHYEQALRIDPGSADAHTNLGNVLASLGRIDEAIAHYRRALELRPESADVKYNLEMALRAQGRARE